jgi:hypothetical protein
MGFGDMRIVCDRCGQDWVISETHAQRGDMLIRRYHQAYAP